jgi:hypothetical protein
MGGSFCTAASSTTETRVNSSIPVNIEVTSW